MFIKRIYLYILLLCVISPNAFALEQTLVDRNESFTVSIHKSDLNNRSSSVILVGGSNGYVSSNYVELTSELNRNGIDVYWLNYITQSQKNEIDGSKNAAQRKIIYQNNMDSWQRKIIATINYIRATNKGKTKIGLLGLSLGAMPVLSVSANNRNVSGLVVIDGNFPENFNKKINYMPDTLILWGEKDIVFTLNNGRKLHILIKSTGATVRMKVMPNENHNYFVVPHNKNALNSIKLISLFFKEKL